MSTPYAKSLQYLHQTFKTFVQQATSYRNLYGQMTSSSLNNLFQVWVNPAGMPNLVQKLIIENQNTTILDERLKMEQSQMEVKEKYCPRIQEVQEPLHTPQRPKAERLKYSSSKKSKSHSLEKDLDQIYEQEEDDIKRQEVQNQSSEQYLEKAYKRGPYKRYSVTQKISAVDYYLKHNMAITDVSKKFGIPCKNIKRWADQGVFRKRAGGSRKASPFMEKQVYHWITGNHLRGQIITIEQIQQYALSKSTDQSFKASRGWVTKFVDRYDLRSKYSIN